jgi:phage terminase small subunit
MAVNEHGLTQKQERFAILVAQGKSQSDAYRGAYDASGMNENAIWVEASRLMDNPRVSLRVKETQDKAAKRAEVTLEEIVEGIREAAQIARTKEEANALTNAYMGLAKVTGQIVDKKEIAGKDGKPFTIVVEKEEHKELLETL